MHDISLTNNKLSIYRIENELLSLLLRIKAGLKIGTDGESSWIIFQQTIARFPEEGERGDETWNNFHGLEKAS